MTRGALAKQEIVNARHPECHEEFKKGVGSILRQWTALELAVFHQWGGASSTERASLLVEELTTEFFAPDKVYKDDVSFILEDYLEANFSTICEDGSPDELGDLLVLMWQQCCVGDFTLVNNATSREVARSAAGGVVGQSQGLEGGDVDDGSDDGINNNDALFADQAELMAIRGEELGTIEEDGTTDMIEDSTPAPPAVDVDGFETVARGKKSKKSNKRSYQI